MPQWCTRQVFRCFKCLERTADRITGAAGPVFVALAIVLISVGAVCFFTVIAPDLPLPLLSIPLCALIALNLFAHYYFVCTVPPGFVDDSPRQQSGSPKWLAVRRAVMGVRWSDDVNVTRATTTRCKRCERSHHCRICRRCYWRAGINQCVGVHNERHFVLFMVYMVVSTACYVTLGWKHVLRALGWFDQGWPYVVPPVAFLMIYILAGVLWMAVTAMAGWQIYMISCGETSVESQDHEQYRRFAGRRGDTFVNCYDLGRIKNLQLFFNVGVDGYPLWTLIIPLRIEPYTDGYSWARKPGHDSHHGVRPGEELTDEDDDM
ncbi:DHHC palmitoyltransferase-domain-containing protein [Epithele typhae]|uniref:DHHC palmitoyltransferase-domain-containing protein n=1 Tax=Epithele typhae TaxID=378194 RepID=UPI0020073EE8|nr:DHHC palmitoyltransferase-domain-containing protein [Epithele typhae]KAH9907095.1 DHHC palmitoyltransferase-domain-containing protein [Epithele typhae]